METDTALRVIYDYYTAEHCTRTASRSIIHIRGPVGGAGLLLHQGEDCAVQGRTCVVYCLRGRPGSTTNRSRVSGVLTFYGFLEWTARERGAVAKDQHPDDDDDDDEDYYLLTVAG